MTQPMSGSTVSAPATTFWQGLHDDVAFDPAEIRARLLELDQPLWIVNAGDRTGLAAGGHAAAVSSSYQILGCLPALPIERFGDPAFCARYGVRYACYGGAMANAIASEAMVIELGKAGLMGSFGAAGLAPARLESSIHNVQAALPDGPYAFNLINSPNEPSLEARNAELYHRLGVHTIEASAYVDLSVPLVYYRAAGLSLAPDGSVEARNRIIVKLSRREVARRFMEPAPADILDQLIRYGKITTQQAELAHRVPVADDVTAEADSGGHTDNRPLVGLIPAIVALRDEVQQKYNYLTPVRVGAAGGISTPAAALAAFMMGAAYVVTGSINQACIEAGASEHTRALLAQASMADVAMAPSSDMFEMGVKVQVLKRGTLFPMRAQKLYEIYSRYNNWDEVPQSEREKLEKTVFKRTFDAIWQDTVGFFTERDPRQVERGNADPHQKMVLVFRWYLGLSSRWSNSGEQGREMDYQIWCGPSMGSFNDWTRGTYLEKPENRRVVDVNLHVLTGAAYQARVRMLALHGVHLPAALEQYLPQQSLHA